MLPQCSYYTAARTDPSNITCRKCMCVMFVYYAAFKTTVVDKQSIKKC